MSAVVYLPLINMKPTVLTSITKDSHYQGCFSIVFTGHSLKKGRLDSVQTALLDLTYVLLDAQTIVLTVC